MPSAPSPDESPPQPNINSGVASQESRRTSISVTLPAGRARRPRLSTSSLGGRGRAVGSLGVVLRVPALHLALDHLFFDHPDPVDPQLAGQVIVLVVERAAVQTVALGLEPLAGDVLGAELGP